MTWSPLPLSASLSLVGPSAGDAPRPRVGPAGLAWHQRALKRGLDLGLASLALLPGAPLIALLAVLVRLDSAGPAFYRQTRVGRDGGEFTLYKLRTMPPDAEPDGPVWAIRGDRRATRLGAWLRRYSLDELPQLWNVLRGDMSLVGPRPERPYFVARFAARIPRYAERHRMRGGLTGWAQVNGLRGDVSIEARTRCDLWYIQHWSLGLDLRILLRTLVELVRRPGY
ncbi:MAG: exopolysaccharide biosynthesis polyprenyl glycosylphosphotransferase [Candidatus Sericytochromatia bacterium]|nr:exopolysaccharide biosynthesis polyprenyl glycosylphosphotransferase [Candidatus Sericytochromatia bacterium]